MPDEYVLRARVCPVIIVGIPLFALLLTDIIFGAELKNLAALSLIGLAVITLLAQIGRSRGKRIERELYRSWKGKPTTVMLRHSDSTIDQTTKKRLHSLLKEKIQDIQLPDAKEERSNPQKADEIYDSAISWLRSNTQDRAKFPRLFEENVSYGFRRNLLGLKPIGVFLAVVIIIVESIRDTPLSLPKIATFLAQPSVIASFVVIGVLLFIVKEEWVKEAAYLYARELFRSLEAI